MPPDLFTNLQESWTRRDKAELLANGILLVLLIVTGTIVDVFVLSAPWAPAINATM